MFVYMFVCVCIYVRTHIHTCTYTHTNTHTLLPAKPTANHQQVTYLHIPMHQASKTTEKLKEESAQQQQQPASAAAGDDEDVPMGKIEIPGLAEAISASAAASPPGPPQ